MATTRDNLKAVLEGGTPERSPLSIYDWNMGGITVDELAARMKEDAWKRLLDLGLGVTAHCEIIEGLEHGVKTICEERQENGATLRIVRKHTPEGEIRKVTRNGWHTEDWIKEPRDYRIVRWIVEHTELLRRYERFAACEEVVGHRGLTILTGSGNWLHRTPLMKINIDWAGTERFCTDVALEVPELFELYEALKEQFLVEQRLLAAAPGRYVKWLENLTIGMIGPRRYRELLVPIYQEGSRILETGGKRVMVHYDGQLEVIADQIAAAPLPIIESVTEPPEGDMTYDTCRARWPDKVLWANLNAEVYQQPPDLLRQSVAAKRQRAGKRALAFEISEALPPNWRETVPIVLKTLDELA
jgi:hypothetical protein